MSPIRLGLAAACAAVILAPTLAHAQSGGIFRGTVTDMSGNGLTGAMVTVGRSAGEVLKATETGTRGRWMIYDLPAATAYELQATLEGYQPAHRVSEPLAAGQVRTVDFVLLPSLTP